MVPEMIPVIKVNLYVLAKEPNGSASLPAIKIDLNVLEMEPLKWFRKVPRFKS